MKRKPSVYNIVIAVILILILIIGSLVIFVNPDKKPVRKPGIAVTEQPAPEAKPVFRKDGELRFLKDKTGEVISRIDIEVARNDAQREQGLMYRDTMPADAGMLFLMEMEETQAFWMKNTIIPLDILYVNSEMRIVSIHKNTTPFSLEQIVSAKPAIYVVEVNTGYTDKYNIKVGDRITF